METPATTAEILRGAAKLLREKGWTQGAYARDKRGTPVQWGDERSARCFCLFGAIFNAAVPTKHTFDAIEAIARYLCWDERLTIWNDKPGRTKEEVIAALEGAADMLEKEL